LEDGKNTHAFHVNRVR